ncbi:pseudouridylate synthase RPUSD2-like isoform X1 [Calliphora vicina]|uniref:pseudouridylate synthase RPUSD2-like isoform X1 n=1 Tax=Calliphora vicina TaxID=7373 RepID=UPI00325AB38D
MQYQPGSWYLPWGIPIQKMLTMPYPQPGSPNAATISPYAATNNATLTCQVLPNQHPSNVNNNTATTIQVQTAAAAAAAGAHNYQHPTFHPNAVGTFACSNTPATLHHNTSAVAAAPPPQHTAPSMPSSNMLNGHGHGLPHLQGTQMQNNHTQHPNTLLPSAAAAAAAAAMFSPLALRTYLASSAAAAAAALNNPLVGVPNQTTLSGCSQVIPQQTPNQVNTSTPQLTCVPSSPSPQHHLNSHSHHHHHHHQQTLPAAINLNVDVVAMRHHVNNINAANNLSISLKKLLPPNDKEKPKIQNPEKRKADDSDQLKDLKKAKLETKALKAKRPGFTDERYHETSYYIENGLRKVYPYYFTFTTFTKGRWVGEKILDVFAREFRAHPAEEYERCIKSGTLTVNYDKVPVDYRLKHNDLLANIVHRHEVPVTSQPITIVHMDDDIVVVNKPASIPVHPCGRYRHNTVVFILAKEYNLKNLRTIHRLDRLTSGLLLFGRSPKKARQMEHQIRNRQVQKEYICRVEGEFPEGVIECNEPIEVVSYKIGVCKVSPKGKDCTTTFQKISYNGKTSVVLCKPLTGRMHQIRVHLQYLGFPVVNDPLYNHEVFGPLKGQGGDIGGKTDEELVRDLINIHNAENWLGIDGDSDISMFKTIKGDCDVDTISLGSETKGHVLSDDDSEITSRETSPTCPNSPRLADPAAQLLKNVNEVELVKITHASDISNLTIADTNNSNEVYEKNDSYSHIKVEVTVATQTGHEAPDMAFNAEKMTSDKHCYECKVRYRDPKPKDLVMYLHAWKYKGPGWEYETMLPNWGSADWIETD